MDLGVTDRVFVVTGGSRGLGRATAEVLGSAIGIDELAERAGTIGYEILTSLGRRYHRVYADATA